MVTHLPPLARFEDGLRGVADPHAALAAGVIGACHRIATPDGPRQLVYAAYVASGRALAQVEDFLRDEVLPFYAYTHTDSSRCGAHSAALRLAARARLV